MHSHDIKTLGEAARAVARKKAPRILAGVAAAELTGRVALGKPSWRDAAAAAGIAVVYPFGEWAIHVYLLHLPPFTWRGKPVELITAASHRMHHERPNDLGMVLLAPAEAAALALGVVPLVVGTGSGLVKVAGGGFDARATLTGCAVGTVLVLAYEWTHFLIHTSHKPRSRVFKSIWKGHRLHHFKNEHYWHGITSTIADHAFGTAPDQRTVPRSPTARTLRTD